jgi:exonuclease SbcC
VRHQRAVLEKELEDIRVERASRYGTRDPDQEEKAISDSLRVAEQIAMENRKACELAEKDFHEHTVRIEALQSSLIARTERIRSAETDFVNAREGEGFADEESFLAACMPGSERVALQAASDDLEQRQAVLHARRAEIHHQTEQEEARALTDQSAIALREEIQQREQRLSALDGEAGALRQQLSAQQETMRRHGLLAARIASQGGICRNWERLHGLIGSADGKKFRNFAQGVTFDLLIGHANHQLSRLSDRYLLAHDPDAPLELAVIDNDQAGEIRSTKNLSGGESFLVSLSLALGLSRMSSRKVRVDSLFLDEGFGTLDDDTLESALETLAGLRQEGKLIGLISHVPAIRERIPVKIQVVPMTGGRSRLTGPGCIDCSDRRVSI